MSTSPVAFIDLKAQRDRIRTKIDTAISKVIDHGAFIMGPEVAELEQQLCDFTGAKHALTCANGTDALQLVLMAENIGPGDAVFVPAMTFVASAEVVPLLGATPFFVDVLPDTFNMNPLSFEQAIVEAKRANLTPKIVIPVDLFGQPANYSLINQIAEKNNIVVVADAAQGFGGSLNGARAGTLATWTTTSFFPAKPLGCYGDGGAIFTDDPERAELIKSLRVHGKGTHKYDNVRVGVNSRLDTIQAAVLKEKLAIFSDELDKRSQIAAYYNAALKDVVDTPKVQDGYFSSWAQYTLKSDQRDQIISGLKKENIPSVIYFPCPIHKQEGYRHFPKVKPELKNAEDLANIVFSLPMHPYLSPKTQDRIINTLIKSIN